MCVHGSTLEERCVCGALGKEDCCSLTAEQRDTPQDVGFSWDSALVQGVEGGHQVFLFSK